jgi:hypothetical protein
LGLPVEIHHVCYLSPPVAGRRARRLLGLLDPLGGNELAETIERVGRQFIDRIEVGLQGL